VRVDVLDDDTQPRGLLQNLAVVDRTDRDVLADDVTGDDLPPGSLLSRLSNVVAGSPAGSRA
jgi:hypothetical protein